MGVRQATGASYGTGSKPRSQASNRLEVTISRTVSSNLFILQTTEIQTTTETAEARINGAKDLTSYPALTRLTRIGYVLIIRPDNLDFC